MRLIRIPRDLFAPIVMSLAIVGVLAYILAGLAQLSDARDDARSDRDRFQAELDAQQKTSQALAQQVENLGGDPIIDPDDATEPVTPDEPASDDFTEADLAAMLTTLCEDAGKCFAQDGEDGKDAKITPALLAKGFARYCDADGCTGRRGQRGPGPTAEQVYAGVQRICADGACVGPQGRPPTPEEIAQATDRGLAAYCAAHNNCLGPRGLPGQDSNVPGPQGEPGRGVQSVSCNADGTWNYTFTDGTSQTISGPCRGRPGEDGKDSNVPGPKGDEGDRGASITQTTCNADGSWTFTYSDGSTSTSPGPCRVTETATPPPTDPTE